MERADPNITQEGKKRKTRGKGKKKQNDDPPASLPPVHDLLQPDFAGVPSTMPIIHSNAYSQIPPSQQMPLSSSNQQQFGAWQQHAQQPYAQQQYYQQSFQLQIFAPPPRYANARNYGHVDLHIGRPARSWGYSGASMYNP